jgi:hypothetical protein
MDERPDQIVQDIYVQRERLGEHLSELETRVHDAADWRTHYDKHPGWFMCAAFGGGFLLAGVLANSGRSSNGNGHSLRAYAEDEDYHPRRGRDKLSQLKGALIGFGAAKVKEAVDDILPGFTDHWK